jgi:hypothetical protein
MWIEIVARADSFQNQHVDQSSHHAGSKTIVLVYLAFKGPLQTVCRQTRNNSSRRNRGRANTDTSTSNG